MSISYRWSYPGRLTCLVSKSLRFEVHWVLFTAFLSEPQYWESCHHPDQPSSPRSLSRFWGRFSIRVLFHYFCNMMLGTQRSLWLDSLAECQFSGSRWIYRARTDSHFGLLCWSLSFEIDQPSQFTFGIWKCCCQYSPCSWIHGKPFRPLNPISEMYLASLSAWVWWFGPLSQSHIVVLIC